MLILFSDEKPKKILTGLDPPDYEQAIKDQFDNPEYPLVKYNDNFREFEEDNSPFKNPDENILRCSKGTIVSSSSSKTRN